MERAHLTRYGLLSVSGDDAREFLHAQLTNNIRELPADRSALAGWCSAKGRLLASFLVIPGPEGFLLQAARDLVPAVKKRLSMFVLRSKVKVADESDRWFQFGVWGNVPGLEMPGPPMGISRKENFLAVKVGETRFLVLTSDKDLFKGKA